MLRDLARVIGSGRGEQENDFILLLGILCKFAKPSQDHSLDILSVHNKPLLIRKDGPKAFPAFVLTLENLDVVTVGYVLPDNHLQIHLIVRLQADLACGFVTSQSANDAVPDATIVAVVGSLSTKKNQ